MNVKIPTDQFLLFLFLYVRDHIDMIEDVEDPVIKKIRSSNLKSYLNQLNDVPVDLRLKYNQLKTSLKNKEYIRISS